MDIIRIIKIIDLKERLLKFMRNLKKGTNKYYKTLENYNECILQQKKFRKQKKLIKQKKQIMYELSKGNSRLKQVFFLNQILERICLKTEGDCINKNNVFSKIETIKNEQDAYARHFGFSNYYSLINEYIGAFLNRKFDFKDFMLYIKRIIIDNLQFNFSKKNLNLKINEEDFEKVLLNINENSLCLFKELKIRNVLGSIDNSIAAAAIIFPLRQQHILLTKENNLEDKFDYIAHELGHIMEDRSMSKDEILLKLLVEKPTSEICSSMFELLFDISTRSIIFRDDFCEQFIREFLYIFIKTDISVEFYRKKISKQDLMDLKKRHSVFLSKLVKESMSVDSIEISNDILNNFKYLLGKTVALSLMINKKLNVENLKSFIRNSNFFDLERILKFLNFKEI